MIVSPLDVINKESKIKLVIMRLEHEPSKPIYVKLGINFLKLTNFWRLNKGQENNSHHQQANNSG